MRNRRELLSAVGGVTLVGLAGCTGDSSEPDPEPESDQSEQQATDSDSETEDGLQIDFTAQDMWEKETQYYESSAKHFGSDTDATEIINPNHIQNADLTNYQEFQTALVNTLNPLVKELNQRDNPEKDSSAKTGQAAAATNLILQQELEENYDNLDIKVLDRNASAHGYTLSFSTDHELTLADSNTDNVGPAKDRPLQNRPDGNELNDPIPQFSEDKLIGDDYAAQINRLRYQRFTTSPYHSHSSDEWRDKIRFDLEKLPSFYEEAVLSENGQLYMKNIRPAIATLANMHEHNHFSNEEYISITSTPLELPTLQEYETLDEYAEELTDNHIEMFDSEEEYEEITMAPDGYNP